MEHCSATEVHIGSAADRDAVCVAASGAGCTVGCILGYIADCIIGCIMGCTAGWLLQQDSWGEGGGGGNYSYNTGRFMSEASIIVVHFCRDQTTASSTHFCLHKLDRSFWT